MVYKLQRKEDTMLVIVIGIRADEEVYEIAQKRADKHNLYDSSVCHGSLSYFPSTGGNS